MGMKHLTLIAFIAAVLVFLVVISGDRSATLPYRAFCHPCPGAR